MSLDMLKTGKKAVGIKQASKSVEKGNAQIVYVAEDAEQRLIVPLQELCKRHNVAVEVVPTMVELGKSCMIEVGAAAVALLKADNG